MNTKNLEYFIKVVETGSFTKAAEESFISHSAISQQIKALEEELKFQLMIRNKKGFTLTDAGKYIYLEGKNIINTIKETTKHAEFISENKNQSLKIGYVENYAYPEIKKALMTFSEQYPEIKISIKGGTHDIASSNNINGITDIMIGDQRKAFSDELNNIYLGDLYYMIKVSNTSSLANRNNITIKDLKGYNCIIVGSREEAPKEIEFMKTTLGFDGDYIYANTITEAHMMVAANLGFLPTANKAREKRKDSSITSIPLMKNERIHTTKLYGYYKKSIDDSICEKLISILKDVLK